MTRSIFDPTGPNTERSGNTFLGADAGNRSHMPNDVVDGVAAAADGTPADSVGFDAAGQPVEVPAAADPGPGAGVNQTAGEAAGLPADVLAAEEITGAPQSLPDDAEPGAVRSIG